MFNWGKSKKTDGPLEVAAPIRGRVIELSQVPDPAFAGGHMGEGVAIEPSEGRVYAPFDGTVVLVMDKSKHAVMVEHKSGVQVLIHVGIETVSLKGNGFTLHVGTGKKVKKGQPLLDFDIAAIQSAGLSAVSPVIVPEGLDAVDRVEIPSGRQADDSEAPVMTVHLNM